MQVHFSPTKFITLALMAVGVGGVMLSVAQPVQAAGQCTAVYAGFTANGNLPTSGYEYDDPGNIRMNFTGLSPNKQYNFFCSDNSGLLGTAYNYDSAQATTDANGAVTVNLNGAKCFGPTAGYSRPQNAAGNSGRYIYIEGGGGNCNGPSYSVQPFPSGLNCNSTNIVIQEKGKQVGCVQIGEIFTYSVSGITKKSGGACSRPSGDDNALRFGIGNSDIFPPYQALSTNCTINGTAAVTSDANKAGQNLTAAVTDKSGDQVAGCAKTIPIQAICSAADRARDPNAINIQPFSLCDQIAPGAAHDACVACTGNVNASGNISAVWTAVGCIKNDPQSIIITVIRIGLGVAGGVTLLMILAASFTFSTSAGDAKKVDEARETITSAVIGLIFIIMSVTILQFIGVQLLQIPGFGG